MWVGLAPKASAGSGPIAKAATGLEYVEDAPKVTLRQPARE